MDAFHTATSRRDCRDRRYTHTQPVRVVLFSGGRTSGYMLRKMIKQHPNFRSEFIVCFANTGKERPETLDFVHQVETRWRIRVVWLEYCRVKATDVSAGIFPTPRRNQNLARAAERGDSIHWFKEVTFETAARNGEPFDELLAWMGPLPNIIGRGCSTQLKVRTVMRYLFSLGVKTYEAYIGIRKDEAIRAVQITASADDYETPKFPLIEWGVTENEVLLFWDSNDFDLRLQSYEGNCDLCFLKARWKRVQLVRENPGSVDWWKAWEARKAASGSKRGAQFDKSASYEKIESLALSGATISRRGKAAVDIPCSCVERAFDPSPNNEDLI